MSATACIRRVIASALMSALFVTVCATAPAGAVASGFGEIGGPAGCLTEPGKPSAGCGEGKGLFEPKALAVSPEGTNIYVVGGIAGNNVASSFGAITILDRNPATGEVTNGGCLSSDGTDGRDGASGSCTPTPSLLGADAVTVSADGRTVFVATRASASVVAFARDPATGALTRLGCFQSTPRPGSPCTPANLFTGSDDLLTSANDSALYVASSLEGAISAFTAPAAPAGEQPAADSSAAPADSSAALAALFTATPGPFDTNPCIAVNGMDGPCAVGVAMKGVGGLTLSREGNQLYAVATESDAIDTFTPAASGGLVQSGCLMASAPAGLCSPSELLQRPRQLAISPDGRNVYVADQSEDGGRIDVLARNASTGQLTDVGCVDYLPEPQKPEPGEAENEEEQAEREQAEAEHASETPDRCERVPGLEDVRALAVSGDGSAVYAFGSGSAVSFARDPSTGALTETGCASDSDTRCSALPDLTEVQAAAVSPDGRDVYVVSASSKALLAFGIGASVASATVAVTHAGLAFVSVACPKNLPHACRGRVLLTRPTDGKARGKRRRRRARVSAGSSGEFAIAAGHKAIVTVRLVPSTRELLHGRRRVRVTAAVRAAPLSGGSGFGRRLLVRLADDR